MVNDKNIIVNSSQPIKKMAGLMSNVQCPTSDEIYKILENVTDPELPVLTILDLGILREVNTEGGRVEVVITPTYSGCPAMNTIETNIRFELLANGISDFDIKTVLNPPWRTDDMTAEGRQKLKEYGIAPPLIQSRLDRLRFDAPPSVSCPICDSDNTEMLSEFGSTACKSLYRCKDCLEPFDYFKCH